MMKAKHRRLSAWNENWNWKKCEKWMKENPLAPWQKFKKAHPSFPYSDSAYYSMRRRINDDTSLYQKNSKTKSRGTHLYQILGKLDKDIIEKSTPLEAMQQLMEIIGKDKSGIELIELVNPRAIEIRRFTRS